jgi:hypothetical protein
LRFDSERSEGEEEAERGTRVTVTSSLGETGVEGIRGEISDLTGMGAEMVSEGTGEDEALFGS